MLSSPAEHDPFNMFRQYVVLCTCVCRRLKWMRFWEMTTNALKLFKGVKKLSRTHQQMSEKKILHNKFIFIPVVDVCSEQFFFLLFFIPFFLSHLTKIYDIQYTRPRIRM